MADFLNILFAWLDGRTSTVYCVTMDGAVALHVAVFYFYPHVSVLRFAGSAPRAHHAPHNRNLEPLR
jgi:hypothetical protein